MKARWLRSRFELALSKIRICGEAGPEHAACWASRSDLRTLPADAALLAFYILPDGTAVADFSEAWPPQPPAYRANRWPLIRLHAR